MSFAHFCARLSWVAQKGPGGMESVGACGKGISAQYRVDFFRAHVAARYEGMRWCAGIYVKGWFASEPEWHVGAHGSAHGTLSLSTGVSFRTVAPGHGSRERGHRQGRPRAACPPGWGHWTGHGCSVACWERPGCESHRALRRLHWAPAAKPPGASEWGCGKGRRLCARVTWLHTGQPESHPGVRYSHSPPEQKTNNAMHSLQVFCTSIFKNICPMLCCGITGGLRRGNTLDKWPVHHRARTHSYSHSHLQTIHSVQFIFPACLWIEEETGARRGNSRQPEEKKQTQKKKKKKKFPGSSKLYNGGQDFESQKSASVHHKKCSGGLIKVF